MDADPSLQRVRGLEPFLSALASRDPTPGGGGAAALLSAVGVALISMVARISLAKQALEPFHAELDLQLQAAEAMRTRFLEFMTRDEQVFQSLMQGYRLPKGSPQEQERRSGVLQAGLKDAALVPLQCAASCVEALRWARRSAEAGSPSVISDSGVAALALVAGLRSAALNVEINLASIQDRGWVDGTRAQLASWVCEGEELGAATQTLVRERL